MGMHEKENAQCFLEAGNFNLSSLILSLIKTFVELDQGCMSKLQKIAPQLANHFSQSILLDNARGMDMASDAEIHKAKARERQAAILEKMKAQQSKFLENYISSEDDEMADSKTEPDECDIEFRNGTQKSAQVICSLCCDLNSKSQVSFLVLLQKSRLLSFTDRGPPLWEQVNQSGKELVSDDSTSRNDLPSKSISNGSEMIPSSHMEDLVHSALNDVSVGQPHEVNAFVEFVKARFPSIKNVKLPGISKDTSERVVYSLEALEEHMYWLIRELPSSLNSSDSSRMDNENISAAGSGYPDSLWLGKYIAALPKEQLDNLSASQASQPRSDLMESKSSVLHSGCENLGPSGCDGIFVSSRGHAVHQGCLKRYLASLREKYLSDL